MDLQTDGHEIVGNRHARVLTPGRDSSSISPQETADKKRKSDFELRFAPVFRYNSGVFQAVKEAALQKLQELGKPPEPTPTDRVRWSQNSAGKDVMSLSGTRRPNFLLFFGSFFGGIPLLLAAGILFAAYSPYVTFTSDVHPLLIVLIFVPFIVIGGGLFLAGLHMMAGQTELSIGSDQLTLNKYLFGRKVTSKTISKNGMTAEWKVRYRQNERPVYGLHFKSKQGGFWVSNALKESELVWLGHAIEDRLDQQIIGLTDSRVGGKRILNKPFVPSVDVETGVDYRSKHLILKMTESGFAGHSIKSRWWSLFLIPFGLVFMLAGGIMNETIAGWLGSGFAAIYRSINDSGNTSGDAPFIFALGFFLAGALVAAIGFCPLFHTRRFEINRGRLAVLNRWFGKRFVKRVDLTPTTEILVHSGGQMNEDDRYRVEVKNNGTKAVLATFLPLVDAQQLEARVRQAAGQKTDKKWDVPVFSDVSQT